MATRRGVDARTSPSDVRGRSGTMQGAVQEIISTAIGMEKGLTVTEIWNQVGHLYQGQDCSMYHCSFTAVKNCLKVFQKRLFEFGWIMGVLEDEEGESIWFIAQNHSEYESIVDRSREFVKAATASHKRLGEALHIAGASDGDAKKVYDQFY